LKVDGKFVTEVGLRVKPPSTIQIDEKVINWSKLNIMKIPKLFIHHKVVKTVVTRNDPEGRPTIFEYTDNTRRGLISVGRSDLLFLPSSCSFSSSSSSSSSSLDPLISDRDE